MAAFLPRRVLAPLAIHSARYSSSFVSPFPHYQSRISHILSPSSSLFSHFQSSSPPQISHFQFLTPTFPATVRHFSCQTYFDLDLTQKYSNVDQTIDASMYPSLSPWFSRKEVMEKKFEKKHGFAVDEKKDLLVGFDKKRKWCLFWNKSYGHYFRKSPFLNQFPDCDYVGLTDYAVINGKESIDEGKPGNCSISFFATNGLKCYFCLGYLRFFSNFYGEVKARGCFLDFARKYLFGKVDIRTDCDLAWAWILLKKVPNDHDLI